MNNTGGTGGSNSYSGAAVTYAAGGSGGGGSTNANAAANTGNGGDINTSTRYGMNGGSGIVILRYANTYPDITTISGGLTYAKTTPSGYKVYTFTAGTGTVTF